VILYSSTPRANYFRGLADDLALMNWLNNFIWPAEKKWLNHEFVVTPQHVIPNVVRDLLSGGTIFKELIDTSRSTLGSMH